MNFNAVLEKHRKLAFSERDKGDLLLSVINVSVQAVDIVNSLPKLVFESEVADEN